MYITWSRQGNLIIVNVEVIKLVFFTDECAGMLLTSIIIYYPGGVSHTHLTCT